MLACDVVMESTCPARTGRKPFGDRAARGTLDVMAVYATRHSGWGVPAQAIALLLSLALVALVSIGGSSFNESGEGSWYAELDKAPWNPPSWVFAPVWTVLYAAMAVAAWLVARTGLDRRDVRLALLVYLAQLGLNFAWTALFFGAERPGWALVDITVLAALVGVTIVLFRPISRAAALLLVPYLVWVAYAASLNGWVVVAN